MLATKHFRDAGPGFPDLLPWAFPAEPGIVQDKDGSFLAGWAFAGPDTQSSSAAELDQLTARVNAALARLGGGWAMWVDAARVPAPGYPPPGASHFPDPVSRLVDEERRRQFEAEGAHFVTEFALVLQYTPQYRQARLVDMIYSDPAATWRKQTAADRALLRFKRDVEAFENDIAGSLHIARMTSHEVVDDCGETSVTDELVNYVHFLLTGNAVQLRLPRHARYLDAIVGGPDFWPGNHPRYGAERIACVSVRGFPDFSTAMLLDRLNSLAIPCRWSSRFVWLDTHEANKVLKDYRRKWKFNVRGILAQLFKSASGPVNEDAVLMVKQLDDAIAWANGGQVAFGYYTPVVVLRHEDEEQLREDARLVVQTLASIGFAAEIEEVNTTEAWLGTLPGNAIQNVRRPPFHTLQLSDLLPLSSVWAGEAVNPCPYYPPGSPPLMFGATTGSTPFRFNNYVSDVGHTMVYGPIGSGKSTLLAATILQARRYRGARIFAFDKGKSLWAATKACGGKHFDLGAEDAPRFCPFAKLETDTDFARAVDWASLCFHLQTGKAPDSEQSKAIIETLALMRQRGTERSLTHFKLFVQNQAVRDAFEYYTGEAPAARLLNGDADEDEDSNLVCCEIGELMEMGEKTLIPVMLHMFRRIDRTLKEGGVPSFILIDEAWTMFGYADMAEKLRAWLKELRKKVCSVVMATQSLSDAVRSGIFDVILESCATRVYGANPEAFLTGTSKHPGPYDFYKKQGLSERQIEIVAGMTPKREYYVVSRRGRRVVTFNFGPAALAFAGISEPKQIEHLENLERQHGARWPFAWLEECGAMEWRKAA